MHCGKNNLSPHWLLAYLGLLNPNYSIGDVREHGSEYKRDSQPGLIITSPHSQLSAPLPGEALHPGDPWRRRPLESASSLGPVRQTDSGPDPDALRESPASRSPFEERVLRFPDPPVREAALTRTPWWRSPRRAPQRPGPPCEERELIPPDPPVRRRAVPYPGPPCEEKMLALTVTPWRKSPRRAPQRPGPCGRELGSDPVALLEREAQGAPCASGSVSRVCKEE